MFKISQGTIKRRRINIASSDKRICCRANGRIDAKDIPSGLNGDRTIGLAPGEYMVVYCTDNNGRLVEIVTVFNGNRQDYEGRIRLRRGRCIDFRRLLLT